MADKKVAKNNTITITVASPLLRPGLTISTEVSAKYAESGVDQLMEIVGKVNKTFPPEGDKKD